ncbi:ABC transporter substrate-binding protein [Bermanella marisrubri]|uniref:ABC-type amino acid transport/signal transduction systems, periplasmic component/domain n=1 Tax=Bermanella marisrubri TaxID=207949 RepID=Q1N661_9GAMM|nr:ABC transporter substrate-binding protein [Bermanella marisrubri]EAT13731.1 ABC-type amino acid transport/signal transduction systems, periplasmic component/domain [Oceanobacter sp. RED65] [Bermanella marisrubri]QIZ84507.1 ABC transporter substrate-binding protein [Bermanella marisrubri]
MPFFALLMCLLSFAGWAEPSEPPPANEIKLVSLYWPPYSGPDLVQQGANIAVARAAFAAVNVELKVSFFPWARTLGLARNLESDFAGYVPEYFADDRAEEFYFSDQIGSGPLGFAKRKDMDFSWSSLDDLTPHRIGVVRGYVNTEEFDQAVRDNVFRAEPVEDDARNLVKLAYRRLDVAVMDENVMRYLALTEAELADYRDQFEMARPYLEVKPLYVCFKKTEQGRLWLEWFNEGLTRINVEAVFKQYLLANLNG